MIFPLAGVLDAARLAAVRELLDQTTFAPGERTAGWHASAVKTNRQAVGSDPAARAAAAMVAEGLAAHSTFQAGVLPHAMTPFTFARYEAGQGYGTHVDDALMGAEHKLRADLAVTVFLSAPSEYGDGEVVLERSEGEETFKLGAGHALVYPATTLHRVVMVTTGVRLVAVAWIQSLVRDPARREVLFDLDVARRDVFRREGKSKAFDKLAKAYANLLRMWAEV